MEHELIFSPRFSESFQEKIHPFGLLEPPQKPDLMIRTFPLLRRRRKYPRINAQLRHNGDFPAVTRFTKYHRGFMVTGHGMRGGGKVKRSNPCPPWGELLGTVFPGKEDQGYAGQKEAFDEADLQEREAPGFLLHMNDMGAEFFQDRYQFKRVPEKIGKDAVAEKSPAFDDLDGRSAGFLLEIRLSHNRIVELLGNDQTDLMTLFFPETYPLFPVGRNRVSM